MKKSDKIFARTKESILLIVLLVLCIPKVVYADSSWIWFTTTAPYQLLPFVAVLTIVIEYLMIKNILHIQNKSADRCLYIKSRIFYGAVFCHLLSRWSI